MTLPVYGNSLSLSQIQGEFGGSNPISLSEYYAGGSYVPSGTVGYPNGGGAVAIPTTGTISINNFFGATAFIPGTVTYTSGSGTFTVPSGTTTIAIEIVGGAGAGGYGARDFVADQDYGGGGGGGGAKSNTSASASGGGQSLSWAVGRGGNYTDGVIGVASTVSGSLISSMSGGGGQPGDSGYPNSSGAGGAGGTASGGNVSNTSGDAGSGGGAGYPGNGGNNYSTGGSGGVGAGVQGDAGAGGYVKFTWS